MLILSSGSLYNYGLNRFFKLAKEAGFSGVEVMITDVWDTREVNYLNKLSNEVKLKVISLHAPFINRRVWSTPQNKLIESLKIAERLKVVDLVVHPFAIHNKTILKLQKSTGVKIAVENMPKQKGQGKRFKYSGYNPMRIDFEYLCLDTTHLATSGLDLVATYQKIKDKIVHIHLSDAKTQRVMNKDEEDDHFLPGGGKLPLVSFLKQLKEDNYKGVISLELKPEALGEGDEKEIVKHLKKAREFVIKYI